MMTGQPYKSPAPAADTTTNQASDVEGMHNDKVTTDENTMPLSPTTTPSLTSPTAAAFRGVSTISAKLKRQRLANQVYKDAWLATKPTLTESITPSELLWKVAPAVPGLVVEEADVAALVDSEDAAKGITCKFCPFYDCGVADRYGKCDKEHICGNAVFANSWAFAR